METVLFGYFFSRSRSRKIQAAKIQDKKRKVWSWYKANERGKLVCLEKALFNELYRLFDISKRLGSESKSMANVLQ